jgi:hypothetical protein
MNLDWPGWIPIAVYNHRLDSAPPPMSASAPFPPPPDTHRPCTGRACTLAGTGWAHDYAAHLLNSLGATLHRQAGPADRHPALAWAQSGAMALTGRADGPPQMLPLPLAACVDGVALAMSALLQSAGRDWCQPPPDAATLGERAALAGLQRQGTRSPGSACHLLHTADGGLAISLPRADDWALVPAWLETDADFSGMDATQASAWEALQCLIYSRSTATLVERARLIGLAAAPLQETDPTDAAPAAWYALQPPPRSPARTPSEQPLVVDLSALWAGPLCSHLLQHAGARVIKVESQQRPDGARSGTPDFYDLLNHGKASVALDFRSTQDLARLRALLQQADIVIEASRPRALRQLGIDAETLVARQPGLTWISLTGHGRTAPQGEWIAYGDDAGVAAGLSRLLLKLTGQPMFCGDAIADPLTGWHAALAALAGHLSGGGLFALALVDVVRHCAQFAPPGHVEPLPLRWRAWQTAAGDNVASPRARRPAGLARPLGADTAAILNEFGIPC